MIAKELTLFLIYDTIRKQYREFKAESNFVTRCSDTLHQFNPIMKCCACGRIIKGEVR